MSNNRNVVGGAARIKGIKQEMEKAEYNDWLTIHSSELNEFDCGDGGKFAAISWIADLSVNRG